MFKKKKKPYSSLDFLPAKQRVYVILQLCVSFCLLLWCLSQPFVGNYYKLRSHSLIYDFVLGKGSFVHDQDKLNRNALRFQQLQVIQQTEIRQNYDVLQSYIQRSFSQKTFDSILFYSTKISPFQVAWIFFSIWISILLLKGRSGANHAVWLLPIIAICYGIDNHTSGSSKVPRPDISLFPDEKIIMERYSRTSGSNVNKSEAAILKEGWDAYLVDNWSQVSDSFVGSSKLEQAEFNFTVARLEKFQTAELQPWKQPYNEKEPIGLLALFFTWNLLFAFKMRK